MNDRRRGILGGLMAFLAASKSSGQAPDIEKTFASIVDSGTANKMALLSLNLDTTGYPENEFGLTITYRGETIDVRMSDIMAELRSLHRPEKRP